MIYRRHAWPTEQDGANVGPTTCRLDSSDEERLSDCMTVIHRNAIGARTILADRLSAPHFWPHADRLLTAHVSSRCRKEAP